jgi:hypothetical protein
MRALQKVASSHTRGFANTYTWAVPSTNKDDNRSRSQLLSHNSVRALGPLSRHEEGVRTSARHCRARAIYGLRRLKSAGDAKSGITIINIRRCTGRFLCLFWLHSAERIQGNLRHDHTAHLGPTPAFVPQNLTTSNSRGEVRNRWETSLILKRYIELSQQIDHVYRKGSVACISVKTLGGDGLEENTVGL